MHYDGFLLLFGFMVLRDHSSLLPVFSFLVYFLLLYFEGGYLLLTAFRTFTKLSSIHFLPLIALGVAGAWGSPVFMFFGLREEARLPG